MPSVFLIDTILSNLAVEIQTAVLDPLSCQERRRFYGSLLIYSQISTGTEKKDFYTSDLMITDE